MELVQPVVISFTRIQQIQRVRLIIARAMNIIVLDANHALHMKLEIAREKLAPLQLV
jgi:hypothetical protein